MPASASPASSRTGRSTGCSEMIDLNVRTLVELCHLVLPAMRARGRGRDPQRRLDRGLPARAEHGGLLCDQGLRPLLHRGAAPRAEGQRHPRLRALPRPDRRASSARSPESQQPDAGADEGAGRRRWCAPASRASTATRRWSIPGWPNKVTAQTSRFLPRAAMRRIVGADQGLAPRPQALRPAAPRSASRGRAAPAGGSAPSGGRRTNKRRGFRPRRRTSGARRGSWAPSRCISNMKAMPSPWAAASRMSWPESKWSIAAGARPGRPTASHHSSKASGRSRWRSTVAPASSAGSVSAARRRRRRSRRRGWLPRRRE